MARGVALVGLLGLNDRVARYIAEHASTTVIAHSDSAGGSVLQDRARTLIYSALMNPER